MAAAKGSGDEVLPGAGLDAARMPGHWLLARLGKRVLRPGGRELTGWLIDGLEVGAGDDVLEVAPGLGATAEIVLRRRPRSYVGVERDPAAVADLRQRLQGPGRDFLLGSAERMELGDASKTVAWAEAVLTMCPHAQRERILAEVARVLVPGGRFGLHELMLVPDDLPARTREAIRRDLSGAIHVGARPLTEHGWRELLSSAGFEPLVVARRPMALLSPAAVVRDEGPLRTGRILANLARDPTARSRVLAMRAVFRRHQHHIAAIGLVARRGG